MYTRVLPAASPFLRVFEDISNLFVGDDDHRNTIRSPKVRHVLNRIVSSDPSEASGYVLYAFFFFFFFFSSSSVRVKF